jgi:cytochrome c-type biogenesis protein CcmH/NrfG
MWGGSISKKCKNCGADNSAEAKFCMQCGQPLNDEPVTKAKNSVTSGSKMFNSYTVLGIAFIIALVIILVILKGNKDHLEAKISKRAEGQKQAQIKEQQPSMEMMKQIQGLKEQWKANPADYDLTVQLGNAYFDIGRFDKAATFYRHADQIKGDQPDILIDLGVAYFNLTKADSALYFVEKALKVDPDHKFGLYNAGIIYYNLNQPEEAIKLWKRLVKKYTGTREANAAKEFIKQIQSEQNKS